MQNKSHSIMGSMMVFLPILGIAALLTFSQRIAVHFGEYGADEPTQTLRPRSQGTGELPVDETDVTITKTTDVEAVRVGNTVQYDIIIQNSSDVTITVDVTDVLPAELRLLNILTGTATLPPEDTSVFTTSVEIAPMDAVTLSYQARVLFIEEPGSDVVNTVTAEVTAPDVSFTLVDSETVGVALSAILLPIVRKPLLNVITNDDFEEDLMP